MQLRSFEFDYIDNASNLTTNMLNSQRLMSYIISAYYLKIVI